LSELGRCKRASCVRRFSRPKDFNLTNVRVSAVLVHRYDTNLQEEGAQSRLVALRINAEQRHGDPALGFGQIHGMHFREIMEG